MKKTPAKKKTSVKKTSSKKATPKKTAAKKAVAKKAAPKKIAAKKAVAKKAAPKKTAAKKTVAKKAAPKKTAAKKTVAKKAAPKKTVAVKSSAKKTVTKKAVAKKISTARPTQAKLPVKKVSATKKTVRKATVTKQLTKTDIAKFQKMLIVERDRLIASINNIEEASRTESGRDNGADLASFAETGTDSFNLETALNIASSESQRLQDVIDALERIEQGIYGICEGSGKPIPKKRLEAFPSARYCVEYQQELEIEAAMSEFR